MDRRDFIRNGGVVALGGMAITKLDSLTKFQPATPSNPYGPYIYPESYGAIGDGVADDTAAVQAAINDAASGGMVFFGQAKTYRCASALSFPIVQSGSIPLSLGLVGSGVRSILAAPNIINPRTFWTGSELGVPGGRVAIENLDIRLQPPSTVYSAADFSWLQLYQKSVFWHIYAGARVHGIHCGGYAGPSQPVTWNNVYIYHSGGGFAVYEWYEGFHWSGGTFDSLGTNGDVSAMYVGGHAVIEEIDLALGGPVISYVFLLNGGLVQLRNIEFPPASQVYQHVAGGNTLILSNPGAAESNGPFVGPFKYMYFNAPNSLKFEGLSLGKVSQPFLTYGLLNALIVGRNGGGGTASANPSANINYRCASDISITSVGGMGVNITITDDFGNIIQSNIATLVDYRMNAGMHINFGAFIATPTVTVFHLG